MIATVPCRRGRFVTPGWLAIAIAASFALLACAADPTFVRFRADKAGTIVSQTVEATGEGDWDIRLAFPLPRGRELGDFYRISALVDGIAGSGTDPARRGRGLSLSVIVARQADARSVEVFNRRITAEPQRSRDNAAIWLQLQRVRLEPGSYVVSVEALDDEPRLADVDVALMVVPVDGADKR
ncbi:MAG TPA: DUF5625 family protein [Burkholderiaceae bacterium]|nr:DUF5625 family protein [Burkholderiaceae bacterium]